MEDCSDSLILYCTVCVLKGLNRTDTSVGRRERRKVHSAHCEDPLPHMQLGKLQIQDGMNHCQRFQALIWKGVGDE